MSNAYEFKREAKALLFVRGRLVRLSLSAVVLLFALMLPPLLGSCLHALLGLIVPVEDVYFLSTVLPWLLMIPFFVLITAPLLIKVKRYVLCVLDDAPLSRCEGRYGHDTLAGTLVLARWTIPLALLVLSVNLPHYLLPREEDSPMTWLFRALFTVLLLIFSALVSFAFLHATRSAFFLSHAAAKGNSVREDIATAKRMHRKNPRLYWRFFGGYLGEILLSVLSIGVLFVFYTLPLLWTASYLAASSLSDETTEPQL